MQDVTSVLELIAGDASRYAETMVAVPLFLFMFAVQGPATRAAFDRYVQISEDQMRQQIDSQRFIAADQSQKAKLRAGEFLYEHRNTADGAKDINVPHGMIQDWQGIAFIPGATIARVKATMQDYERYKTFYAPDITESKVVDHKGEDWDIFLRIYKKQFLTVVLNANYRVHYDEVSPARLTVNSHSTRIAEVKNPDKSLTVENPPGNDTGLLWALNSYWRFEEADGGVYAQLRAISLSRDIPWGLGWLKGWLESFPRDSLRNTLEGTKRAVAGSAAVFQQRPTDADHL